MLKKCLRVIIITLFLLAIKTVCFATNILDTNDHEKIYDNNLLIIKDCKQEEIKDIANEIEINSSKYRYVETIEKEQKLTKAKQEEKTLNKILTNNTMTHILSQFPKEINFNDNEYVGTLFLNENDIIINNIDNGYREEKISETVIYPFCNTNDLNNIPKTITKKGIVLLLTNPKFEVIQNETIDNNSIPVYYKGLMTYEGIGRFKNANSYNVIAKYQGEVTKQENEKIYDLKYEKYNEVVEETKQEIPYVTISIMIILSGILLFTFFFVYNIKIYAVNKRNKILKVFNQKLSPINPTINIDKYNKKINCYQYRIELNNRTFKKFQNKDLCIILDQNKTTQRILQSQIYVIGGNTND